MFFETKISFKSFEKHSMENKRILYLQNIWIIQVL